MTFSRYLLLFLAVIFGLELAAPLPDTFNIFISLMFLYIFFFVCAPLNINTIRHPAYVAALAITIASVYLFMQEPLVRAFGFPLFLSACALSRRSMRAKALHLDPIVLALTLYAALFYIDHTSGLIWHGSNVIIKTASRFASSIYSERLTLGETLGGSQILLLFLLFLIVSRISSGRRKFRDYLYPLAWVISAWLIYAAYLAFLPHIYDFATRHIIRYEFDSNTTEGKTAIGHLLLFSPLILFAILTSSIRFMPRHDSERTAGNLRSSRLTGKRLIIRGLIIATFSSAAFCFLNYWNIDPNSKKGEVLLYEKGYLNWLVPIHGDYGKYSTGMFGQLQNHLSTLGTASRRISEINETELGSASALILINIDHEISRDVLEQIWRFVENGGTLLFLGDHTFLRPPGVNYLNTCLEPFDIKFNFDSAEYLIGGWLNSYRFMRHPLTLNIADDRNQPCIVVGASLSIKPPALPLVIGTFGFSDAGNDTAVASGYLGNLLYDPGEPLGDQILVAAQEYGRGRVLVFGDTSGFTNPLSIWSYPFTKRVLAWLTAESREGIHWQKELIVLLLLFISLIIICNLSSPANGLYCLLPGLIASTLLAEQQSKRLDLPPSGSIAYIDVTHVERIPLEGWRKGGVMGLHLNLQREGYLTYALQEFKHSYIEKSDLLAFIAPAKKFSNGEIEILKRFVNEGGKLLLCIGYEEKAASMGFLSSLGLDIRDIPLGNFSIQFNDSLEVKFVEAWPVADASGRSEVIASDSGYALILYKRIGKGGVLLIGDSFFFTNENLEHGEHAHYGSIEFLRYLVKRYLKS